VIDVRCPQCNTVLEAPDDLAGKAVVCPSCGSPVQVPVPASAEVIDVRAVVLNDPGPEKEPNYEDDPFFNPEYQHPPTGSPWGRTIRIDRGGDGSGCCLLGCAGIVVFIFLALKGLFSLF